jgi:DNA-binding response OmpR family regulator
MSKHILVVEDDDQIAAIVRDGLIRMGYRVELAADGPAALAAVRTQPCDLVVLDLLLPGMDGVEVCQRLRARGGPPVIMLTASALTGTSSMRPATRRAAVSGSSLASSTSVSGNAVSGLPA